MQLNLENSTCKRGEEGDTGVRWCFEYLVKNQVAVFTIKENLIPFIGKMN